MLKQRAAILDSSLLVRRSGAFTALKLQEVEPVPAPVEASTVNATIRMPKALHRRLRVLATHSQRAHQDIIRDALKKYLDDRGEADPACGCMQQTSS